MLLAVLSWFISLLAASCGGKLPDPEVKVEVLHRPFLCHRKSKYGDMLLVHHEGYFENGTRFHNRYDLFLLYYVSATCDSELKIFFSVQFVGK